MHLPKSVQPWRRQEAHAAGGRVNWEYKRGVEILIESRVKPERETVERTLEDVLKREQREEEEAQLDLFPLEDLAKTKRDRKLAILERHWPGGLWTDENGKPVTVTVALASSALRREALAMFRDRASVAKGKWKIAVFEAAVFANLVAEVEAVPRPTAAQMRAYSGTIEWKHACGVVLSKDGKYCAECGRTEGAGVRLHVHHVAKVRDCWALRADPAFMQVVCDECHPGEEQSLDEAEAQYEREPEPA